MGLNIKLIHILSVFILGAAYSSLVSASAEIISTDSFCPKCNLYSHRANGIDLLVMASPNTEAPDDFLNRIDNIAVYTDRILRHPFFKSTFTTNFSEIGILLDYEKRITGGFYFPQLKTKNFGPVIVVNPDAILINQDMYYLLAHELTHLFHYSYRPHETVWLREALAQVVQYYITDYFSVAFKVAYEKPETSLIIEEDNIAKQSLDGDTPTDEFDVTNYSRTAQYGHVLQYAFYLQKNCGGPDLIYNLLTNTSNLYGTSFIDFILKQQGLNKSVCKSFENSFIAFQKARFAPKPYSNEDFISSMPLSGKIRTSQLENPPPFSAQAFKSKLCPKSRTQFFIDKDVCLKIRLGD